MLIVLSPAKSLDFSTNFKCATSTKPIFQNETSQLVNHLKKLTIDNLQELMSISKKLGELNHQRFQDFQKNPERQALLAFDGDVYAGIDKENYNEKDFNFAQNHVVILSGLYGLLKPLDLMQPYRLEMGTKLPIGANKNLYEFWKATITKELNSQLEKDELFVNLASNEYFDAVDVKKLKVPVVTPEFKDYKDGKLKIISFFAKKARGMMVRYILDSNAQTIDDLKGFNHEGYAFDANLSKGDRLVFTR